jgi:hypothetical protein
MMVSLIWLAPLACIPVRSTDATPPPQITLTGARLQSFKGSVLVATGRAAQVTYQRTNGDMTASEALLRFPTPDKPTGMFSNLEVRAPEMTGNLTTKQGDGFDGVVVKSASGMVGRTDRAHFDGQTMTASGKDFVAVDGPGYKLTGVGFLIHLREETAQFGNPVSSRLGESH